MEYIWSYDNAKGRTYSKACKNGTFSKKQAKDPAQIAVEWLLAQGEGTREDPFSHGSGRKTLARWCSKYKVPYEQSFHVHSDLPKTWRDSYQPDLPKTTCKERNQSKAPDVCMEAVRTLAMNWGLGIKKKPQMSMEARFAYHRMMKENPELAQKIALGIDSDEELDLPPKVEVEPTVAPASIAPVPRKRRRSVVKPEPDDSDYLERPETKKSKRKRKPAPEPKAKRKPSTKPKKRKRT